MTHCVSIFITHVAVRYRMQSQLLLVVSDKQNMFWFMKECVCANCITATAVLVITLWINNVPWYIWYYCHSFFSVLCLFFSVFFSVSVHQVWPAKTKSQPADWNTGGEYKGLCGVKGEISACAGYLAAVVCFGLVIGWLDPLKNRDLLTKNNLQNNTDQLFNTTNNFINVNYWL